MSILFSMWVNVDFERRNEFKSFDKDYTSDGSRNYPNLQEIFRNCEYGEKYYH